MNISAYIPAYNSSSTLSLVIQRLRQQTVPLSEILVVDDGSTDETTKIGESEGVRVIRFEDNMGRGYCRAIATEETKGDYILACDSTCGIEPDFAEKALKWLANEETAAAFGWLWDPQPRTKADQWRNRHLFSTRPNTAETTESFVTTGSLIKRGVFDRVGNYDRTLRHSEDAELGNRIVQNGYTMVSDPSLTLVPLISNSSAKVVERYLRWNLGPTAPHTLTSKLKFAHYAFKTLLGKDLRARDIPAAAITVQCIFRSLTY